MHVFERISYFEINQAGPLPNAWVELVEAVQISSGKYKFQFSIGGVDESAVSHEYRLVIICGDLRIVDSEGISHRDEDSGTGA
jgi:hypothetical protein